VRSEERWTTPSELAEYAYCPRAHYYRQTYGSAPPSRRSVAGERYHARTLGGELRRSAHGSAYWALVGIGALLVLGALAVFLWR